VALVGVGFLEGTAEIAMTRDAMTMARAARKSGGLVIAQLNRVGTLEKLPPGQVIVLDALVDVLVATDGYDRTWDMFASTPASRM
jgi:acyl CoA:acetate/3-ketoacid CoA transferase